MVAPSASPRLLQCVTKHLERVHMYLDDATAHDADRQRHVDIVRSFFSHLEEYNLKLALSKARIGATEVSFLRYSVSGFGRRPYRDKTAVLSETPMPKDIGQLRLLLGGLLHYRRFLPNVRNVCSLSSHC